MTKTATITWTLPTKRPFAADFSHSIISLSLDDGANFTEIANVPTGAPDQEAVAGNLDVGQWIARGILFDVDGRASPPAEAAFFVPDESAPDALVDLGVTLS